MQNSRINVNAPQGSKLITYSFKNQFTALFKKQWTYQRRQIKTNICQILFPLVLLFVLFLIQQLVTGFIRDSSGEYSEAIKRPSLQPSSLLLPRTNTTKCSEDFQSPRTTTGLFLYADNGNADVGIFAGLPNPNNLDVPEDYDDPNVTGQGLLGNMTTSVSFLPAFKGNTNLRQGNTQSFCFTEPFFVFPEMQQEDNKTAMDDIFFEDWAKKGPYVAGYDFRTVSLSSKQVIYGLMYNMTLTRGRDLMALMGLVSNAVWKTFSPNQNLTSYTGYGTKNFPTPRTKNDFDLISIIGPQLYIYIFHLSLPVIMSGLVFEKENKLREIMKMMGLKTPVYWLVQYIFYYLIYLITTFLIIGIAAAMGFRFFSVNNFFPIFFLFFIWGHTMMATAFLLSVFFTRSSTAIVVGYVYVFLIGLLAVQLIQPYFASTETPESTQLGIMVIPPFAFYRGLYALTRAVSFNGPGMSIAEMTDPLYRMDLVYYFLVGEWLVFMLIAIYFELVVPIGPGVKQHPLFCFPRKMRCVRKDESTGDIPEEANDVSKERTRLNNVNDDDPNIAIKVRELRKVYPGVNGMPKKVAVNNLTMGINEGECFGFLGPNGAGKSTTINMLCGYLRPTKGYALIRGLDIRNQMDEIHLQMGVCPQDNVLWDDLTGPEHLEFYGRLKNLTGKELKQQVRYWLEQVNLWRARKKLSRQYSGGMKRRLCVAVALIGNPKVVLLDEPTTGLDPASRRQLWETVINYKKHCSMMLTTHSMEEAEALCDRLGIFVGGKLKAVGPSAELKTRWGQAFKIVLTTPVEYEEQARSFLLGIVPRAKLINTLAGTAKYEAPKSDIELHKLFRAIEDNKERLHILDWGISNTTLEEVFLKITDTEVDGEMADVLARAGKGENDDKDGNNVELKEIKIDDQGSSDGSSSSSEESEEQSSGESNEKSQSGSDDSNEHSQNSGSGSSGSGSNEKSQSGSNQSGSESSEDSSN
jgi:ABC-type multidrug transport system ATPase subunit